jgi:hypothetical protein
MCFTNSQGQFYKKGVANATLCFKSKLEADTPLCVLYNQETGFCFELHIMLFPEAFLFKKIIFLSSIEAHLGWKSWISTFSETNMAHKLKGVKKGVIERVSAHQDSHDALCHHFEIEHVCDGTITIALIIDIGIVTSSRCAIVPPHLP